MTPPPGAQERAAIKKIMLHYPSSFVNSLILCEEIEGVLAEHVAQRIAQAVQAAYEHAAEIAQDHQCPHHWHSCGGDIAAALRARPGAQQ